MSCADVCIDMGYDEPLDFYREKFVTARKPHECVECKVPINRGDRYWLANGKTEDHFFACKTCPTCKTVRDAFVCGTWIFGDLWMAIE